MKTKNFGRYALRIFGLLCAFYGAGLLISGKGSGMVPVWLFLGCLCVGLSLKKPFDLVFSRRWARLILWAGVTVVVISEGIIAANGCRLGPWEPSDYIVVLGAKVDGEVPSRTLRYRLETAYQYLMTFKDAKAVLSGGQGDNEGISEAEAMRRYLLAGGISGERLILEDRSTNTYENLRNSFALLGDHKNLKLTIVTSDFHMLRAKLLAFRLGRQVSGVGAKTSLPLVPNYYLREMFGVLKELVVH